MVNDLFFSLISSDGQKFSLEELISTHKFVVIFFYPRDDTPKCRIEVLDFSRLLDQFKVYGSCVIGISPDSINSHKNFQTKYNIKVDLLSDIGKLVCKNFNVLKKKKMFGKEYLGVSRSTFILSKNENVEILYKEHDVKVEGHAENILKKVIEFSNGIINV